jgi:hypothetical protein
MEGSASTASINNLTSYMSITLGRGRKVWSRGERGDIGGKGDNNH